MFEGVLSCVVPVHKPRIEVSTRRSMVQLRTAMLRYDMAPYLRSRPFHVGISVGLGKPLGVGTGPRLGVIVVEGSWLQKGHHLTGFQRLIFVFWCLRDSFVSAPPPLLGAAGAVDWFTQTMSICHLFWCGFNHV